MAIKELFLDYQSKLNSPITVCGWITNVRKQTDHVFLSITDGSTADPLQIVVMKDEYSDSKS